jgi:hypothetical protein
MNQQAMENKRRSSRVFIKLPVLVSGKNAEGRNFRESGATIVINAHGGLVIMSNTVRMDDILQVSNPATSEELECRVVFLSDLGDKGQRVGLEFLAPAPHFWGVEFPPTDWPAKQASAGSSAVN